MAKGTDYRVFFSDMAERAAATFVQTLVVVLFAAKDPVMADAKWGTAALAGAIAAAVSVLTTLASVKLPDWGHYADLLLRTVKTFVQAFVGAIVVVHYVDVNWAGALATALPVALAALAKGLVAMTAPGTSPGPGLVPTRLTEGKRPVTQGGRGGPGQSLADHGE